MCPLVCPFSIWPGQGFYIELFLLMHFLLGSNQNGKRCFPSVFSEKKYSLLRFCIILGDIEIFINLYSFKFINFISTMWGKAGLSMASCFNIKDLPNQENWSHFLLVCVTSLRFNSFERFGAFKPPK